MSAVSASGDLASVPRRLDPATRRIGFYYLGGGWLSFVLAAFVVVFSMRLGVDSINESDWLALSVFVLGLPAAMFQYALLWEAVVLLRWKSLFVLLLAFWPAALLIVVVCVVPLALLSYRTSQFINALRLDEGA